MTMADVALAAGDDAEATRLARTALGSSRMESNEPQVRGFLMYSLGAQRLTEEVREAADELRDGVFQGPLSKAFQAVGDATALALEGRGLDARRRYTEGFDAFRQMEQVLELARWEILAVALQPDAPEAPNWAAEARQLLEAVNARAYLERLDAVSPASLRTTAALNARSASTQVAEPS